MTHLIFSGGFELQKRRGNAVSKQYPECPLYNHANCKEYENPTLCAIVREDKICIKKKAKKSTKKSKAIG